MDTLREAGVTSAAQISNSAAPIAAASVHSDAPPAAAVAGPREQHEDKKPRLDSASTAAAAAASTAAGVTPTPSTLRPFAVVDEVADGSPAAAAGIQLGDQLCRWGAAVRAAAAAAEHFHHVT